MFYIKDEFIREKIANNPNATQFEEYKKIFFDLEWLNEEFDYNDDNDDNNDNDDIIVNYFF